MSAPTDKLLDHNYDDIQEYDNPLPRWWVQLFMLTVAWSIFYVPYYASGAGQSPEAAYEEDMAEWNKLHPPVVLATAEEMASIVTDPAKVAQGKEIFATRCAACHAADGGGLVGPNLTDAYWIHGGKPVAIAKTIYDGVPEKGMIPWKTQMSVDEIYAVTAYLHTGLKGTTPATAKAPEGTQEAP
jgi:cytochrome c oxidase cbb3-type subunit 3